VKRDSQSRTRAASLTIYGRVVDKGITACRYPAYRVGLVGGKRNDHGGDLVTERAAFGGGSDRDRNHGDQSLVWQFVLADVTIARMQRISSLQSSSGAVL
jgi:hypothetical protein